MFNLHLKFELNKMNCIELNKLDLSYWTWNLQRRLNTKLQYLINVWLYLRAARIQQFRELSHGGLHQVPNETKIWCTSLKWCAGLTSPDGTKLQRLENHVVWPYDLGIQLPPSTTATCYLMYCILVMVQGL